MVLPSQSYGTSPFISYGITQCYLLVGCYQTQVNAPCPNPNPQVSIRFTYLGGRDGRLSLPRLPGNGTAGSRTRDLSITSPTP